MHYIVLNIQKQNKLFILSIVNKIIFSRKTQNQNIGYTLNIHTTERKVNIRYRNSKNKKETMLKLGIIENCN